MAAAVVSPSASAITLTGAAAAAAVEGPKESEAEKAPPPEAAEAAEVSQRCPLSDTITSSESRDPIQLNFITFFLKFLHAALCAGQVK